jgi:hypothetical protein
MFKSELGGHQQKMLGTSSSQTLMLRQLAAATGSIVAWISTAGIIGGLDKFAFRKKNNGSVRF